MRGLIQQKMVRWAFIIMLISSLLLVILMVFLSGYDHPSADDFNYSVNVKQYGFLGAQYYWYISWCGRYFSTFMLSLNPLVFWSFTGYKIASALLILLSAVSFYLFSGSLFKFNSNLEKIYLASLSFFAFILMMPSMAEGYYWFAGAFSYQIGNILTLSLFAAVIAYRKRPSKNIFIVSSVVVFALAGTNEYAMLFLVLFLSFLNALWVYRYNKVSSYYLVLLLLAIGGSAIVYFAPGNSFRASFQTNNFQFLFSLKNSFKETLDVLSHWWWVGGILAIAGFSIVSSMLTNYPEVWIRRVYLNPFLIVVFIFLIIAAGFFSCYWSLGLYPPLRTINTIYFFFIIGSLYAGFCFAVLLRNFKIPYLPYIHYVVLVLLFIYVIKIPGNISRAYGDLKDGVASAYDKELNARYEMLQTSNCKKCGITKLKNIPKTLFFTDISEKTDHAMLRSYAYYFDKDSVFVASN
jgi:hypothetical protein